MQIKIKNKNTALKKLKALLRKFLPKSIQNFYTVIPRCSDIICIINFLFKRHNQASLKEKIKLIIKSYYISYKVDSPHFQNQIISFIDGILSLSPKIKGYIIEAGAYKGGSTAKFSLAAKLVNRKLLVFDSFEGMPENNEPPAKNIFGDDEHFPGGCLYGSLEEVKNNIKKYGAPEVCQFVKGYFDKTMVNFSQPAAAIYLDVDLAASTKTSLKYLYPQLQKNGILYSEDGHFPNVIKVFDDDNFWEKEVGCRKPEIEGLGKSALIKIVNK